uniref:Uncharacterized protein n=1 Tax=Oryza brachyantha TaxID=4533 RepID=J3LVF5_ORYBR
MEGIKLKFQGYKRDQHIFILEIIEFRDLLWSNKKYIEIPRLFLEQLVLEKENISATSPATPTEELDKILVLGLADGANFGEEALVTITDHLQYLLHSNLTTQQLQVSSVDYPKATPPNHAIRREMIVCLGQERPCRSLLKGDSDGDEAFSLVSQTHLLYLAVAKAGAMAKLGISGSQGATRDDDPLFPIWRDDDSSGGQRCGKVLVIPLPQPEIWKLKRYVATEVVAVETIACSEALLWCRSVPWRRCYGVSPSSTEFQVKTLFWLPNKRWRHLMSVLHGGTALENRFAQHGLLLDYLIGSEALHA